MLAADKTVQGRRILSPGPLGQPTHQHISPLLGNTRLHDENQRLQMLRWSNEMESDKKCKSGYEGQKAVLSNVDFCG